MTDVTDRPTPTRTVEGTTLPAAGRWRIDPGHTEVAFVGRHFLVTRVRGRFTDVSGAITVGDEPEASSVDVTIAMASISSGNPDRDAHLRSAELFDVERHPEARFASRHVTWHGAEGRVVGDLTLHGVTRPVALRVTFEGYVRDPWGGDRAVFSARGTLDREDFGITWNMALEAGGLLVSKEVAVEIDLEAVLDG